MGTTVGLPTSDGVEYGVALLLPSDSASLMGAEVSIWLERRTFCGRRRTSAPPLSNSDGAIEVGRLLGGIKY